MSAQAEELGDALRHLGLSSTAQATAALLRKYDADGNGVLDFDEFKDLARGRASLHVCHPRVGERPGASSKNERLSRL